MSGFKKAPQPLSQKTMSESEFESGGRAAEVDSVPKQKRKTESKNKDNKTFTCPLPIELIDRLKRYQNREDAKRIETQTYIVTQALSEWLDRQGFEK